MKRLNPKTNILAVVLVAALLFWSNSGAAETASMQLLGYERFAVKDIPIEGAMREALAALDYLPDELPFAHATDLNGDGVEEMFFGSPGYRLCGTAGCPYLLFEGNTRTLIGEFFGTLALTNLKVNGYPVIHAVSKRDLETTNLQIFVFSDGKYTLAGHALLESKGMDEWSGRLTKAPEKKP